MNSYIQTNFAAEEAADIELAAAAAMTPSQLTHQV